jgi:hypothetical protein
MKWCGEVFDTHVLDERFWLLEMFFFCACGKDGWMDEGWIKRLAVFFSILVMPTN